MSFLLDTNILSAHLRRPAGLAHRFFQHSGRLYTSSICLGELYVWAYGRHDPAPMVASIEKLLQHEVGVAIFDEDCARQFGKVRVDLRRQGTEADTVDLMIASVALVHDLTLVTHNTADFRFIPGLRLDDWLAP
jgi:tRNA(fMet)-specific endonuclease VapC